jgi:hypothetical protein
MMIQAEYAGQSQGRGETEVRGQACWIVWQTRMRDAILVHAVLHNSARSCESCNVTGTPSCSVSLGPVPYFGEASRSSQASTSHTVPDTSAVSRR